MSHETKECEVANFYGQVANFMDHETKECEVANFYGQVANFHEP